MKNWTRHLLRQWKKLNSQKLIDKNLQSFGLLIVDTYQQYFSFFFGGNCRFYPSCSHYGKEAFQKQPFLKACALIVFRILKCHPFGPSGFDPVPENIKRSKA